jgi:hypothetical protein
VCEEGVDPCDEGCAPDVRRRPAIREEFGWGGEREGGRVEEGEEVGEEEAAVGDDLERVSVCCFLSIFRDVRG